MTGLSYSTACSSSVEPLKRLKGSSADKPDGGEHKRGANSESEGAEICRRDPSPALLVCCLRGEQKCVFGSFSLSSVKMECEAVSDPSKRARVDAPRALEFLIICFKRF